VLKIFTIMIAAVSLLASTSAHALTSEQEINSASLKNMYLECIQNNSPGWPHPAPGSLEQAYLACWRLHDQWLTYQAELGEPIALSRYGEIKLQALKQKCANSFVGECKGAPYRNY
jgi:hypothetical protein